MYALGPGNIISKSYYWKLILKYLASSSKLYQFAFLKLFQIVGFRVGKGHTS